MPGFPGHWKRDGYVVPVPIGQWRGLRVVRVHNAAARILRVNRSLCYVVIPTHVRDADQWTVEVRDGALIVRPPQQTSGGAVNVAKGNAQVGMQVGVMHGTVRMSRGDGGVRMSGGRPVTIGLVLPRDDIHVHDQL